LGFHVVNHDPRGDHPPFGGNGALLFAKRLDGSGWHGSLSYGNISDEAPDFSHPNETYWQHVDALLTYAHSQVFLFFSDVMSCGVMLCLSPSNVMQTAEKMKPNPCAD
jgi:hypothetical protein